MSAALTPRPPMPAAAGATQGMPVPQQNPLQPRWQITVRVVQEMVHSLERIPGVDQQLVAQAKAKMGEGGQLIAQAMRSLGAQGNAPAAAASPAPAPPATPIPPR